MTEDETTTRRRGLFPLGSARCGRSGLYVHVPGDPGLQDTGNHLGYGYLPGAAKGFPQETTYDVDDFRIHTSDPGW